MDIEKVKHIAILSICLLVSVGWISYGAISGHVSDGARGGSIAVAISFATIFLDKEYDSDPLNIMNEVLSILSKRASHIDDVRNRIKIIEEELSIIGSTLSSSKFISDTGSKFQNKFLAASSITGTLAWGFGDTVSDKMHNFLLYMNYIN